MGKVHPVPSILRHIAGNDGTTGDNGAELFQIGLYIADFSAERGHEGTNLPLGLAAGKILPGPETLAVGGRQFGRCPEITRDKDVAAMFQHGAFLEAETINTPEMSCVDARRGESEVRFLSLIHI